MKDNKIIAEFNNCMTDKDKVLEWFNHFTDYVHHIDSTLYNEACDYADEKENDNE